MAKVLGGDPTCPIARALEVVGDRWSLLVIREAAFGSTRFSQFKAALGISPDVLSARLSGLTEAGVLRREPYREGRDREREQYQLTPAGRALLPVLAALGEWGLQHRPLDAEPGTRFRERETHRPVTVRFTDGNDRILTADEVTLVRTHERP